MRESVSNSWWYQKIESFANNLWHFNQNCENLKLQLEAHMNNKGEHKHHKMGKTCQCASRFNEKQKPATI